MALRQIEKLPDMELMRQAQFDSMSIDKEGNKRFTILVPYKDRDGYMTLILHVPPTGEATWWERF